MKRGSTSWRELSTHLQSRLMIEEVVKEASQVPGSLMIPAFMCRRVLCRL